MATEQLHSRSAADTEALARELSLWARPGMAILLEGDLGAGKSTFARAFIRALAANDALDVPSPTFTLVLGYDETRIPTFHADLYRLERSADIAELGLAELLQSSVGLIEWAERLPGPLCPDVLHVTISGTGEERRITLVAQGLWQPALLRNQVINGFVDGGGIRYFLEGDASARRYEWIATADDSRPLIMDMPSRPDGPAVKDGKSYSAIAHLAEGLRSVIAINTQLQSFGYSAPRILKYDLGQGLALIENLGDKVFGKMLLAGEDMSGPMLAAAALLADMATKSWPETIESPELGRFTLPPYDEQAQLIEVDLLPSWYWPYKHDRLPPQSAVRDFVAAWRKILPLAVAPQPQWVMRDFHSPNLIWLPQRDGVKRVGLIDTQDAVRGHAAYDLVSLIQDARVDIPHDLAAQTLAHYLALRRPDPGFSESGFLAAYAVLGAQRSTKILGIFARLSKRDGKHGYLRHMPRVARNLAQNLEHPALAELKNWYVTHLPDILELKS